MTPERKAEIDAVLDKIFGRYRPPKPKVVTKDGVVVRDAEVHVSKADVNAKGTERVVKVRRQENWKAVDVSLPVAMFEAREAERAERRSRRAADALGVWGPYDD